jgi:hypothetical protein
MIPKEEIDRLTQTVGAALTLAAQGQMGKGYTLLSRGLQRARGLSSDPWNEELVRRWQAACDHYAGSFGVRLPDSDP